MLLRRKIYNCFLTKKQLLIISLFLIFTNNTIYVKASENIKKNTVYSLDNLYISAYAKSEKIKKQGVALNIAQEYKKIAFSSLLPQLSAYADYSRYLHENMFQPKWNASYNVKLEQSFTLNGKEFIYYNISKAYVHKTYFELWALTENYFFEIAKSYYDYLRSIQAEKIAHANLIRLESHKNAVYVKLKVKEVPKTAIYRANAEYAKAKTDIVRAQNTLKIARKYLARISCIEEPFELKELKPLEIEDYKNLDKLILQGFTMRGEIIAAKIDNKITKASIDVAKGEYYPKFSIEGLYTNNKSNNPDFTDYNVSGTASINFSIFDGGIRNARLSEAKIKNNQSKLSLVDLQKDIKIEITNAFLELETQESVLKSLQEEVKYWQENYNAIEKQFKFGLANSIDVVDANTLLVTSQRQLSDAKYSLEFSKIKLKKATGVLLWDIAAMFRSKGIEVIEPDSDY